jgi:hypothetical protein
MTWLRSGRGEARHGAETPAFLEDSGDIERSGLAQVPQAAHRRPLIAGRSSQAAHRRPLIAGDSEWVQ